MSECHRLFLEASACAPVQDNNSIKTWVFSEPGLDGSCIPHPKYNVTGAELRFLFSWEKTWLWTGTIALPHQPIPALMLAL